MEWREDLAKRTSDEVGWCPMVKKYGGLLVSAVRTRGDVAVRPHPRFLNLSASSSNALEVLMKLKVDPV
jgi:hypothetical protein